jgi:hypothetical protein
MIRPDFYKILGVSSNATQKEIEAAYRTLVRTCHPDVCRSPQAEEQMKDINEAYEVLGDPEKRLKYDREQEKTGRIPVRKERPVTPDERPRADPWNRQPQEPAAPPQPMYRVPYAACAAGLCVFLLILIFVGTGTSGSPPDQKPETLPGTPTLLVTPYPLSFTGSPSDKTIRNVTNSHPFSLVPGPTRTPPSNLNVFVQLEKDISTKVVTVSFAGGDGQPSVKEILFRLTRSDRQILENHIVLEPSRKTNEVTLPGTGQRDRAEVIVIYYSGDQYTVIDQLIY